MTSIVSVIVSHDFQTVERVVSRLLGKYVAGVVEATYERNRGLARYIFVPVGTKIEIPMPAAKDVTAAEDVIYLTD